MRSSTRPTGAGAAPRSRLTSIPRWSLSRSRSARLSRDHILDNITHWRGAWERLEISVEEVIDGGDRVVVVARHRGRGRGRGSGIDIDARFFEVYTLRDAKIVRIEEFMERRLALEAAGLSE